MVHAMFGTRFQVAHRKHPGSHETGENCEGERDEKEGTGGLQAYKGKDASVRTTVGGSSLCLPQDFPR